MNRVRTLPRMGAALAGVALVLFTLTGCPVVSSEDGDGEDEGDDYIHFSLVR